MTSDTDPLSGPAEDSVTRDCRIDYESTVCTFKLATATLTSTSSATVHILVSWAFLFLFVLLFPKMTFVTAEELAALENLRVLFVRPDPYLLPSLNRVCSPHP